MMQQGVPLVSSRVVIIAPSVMGIGLNPRNGSSSAIIPAQGALRLNMRSTTIAARKKPSAVQEARKTRVLSEAWRES